MADADELSGLIYTFRHAWFDLFWVDACEGNGEKRWQSKGK